MSIAAPLGIMMRLMTIEELYERLWTRYGPQHWWPASSRFEMIVGAVLTQNTAWVNVEKALTGLRSRGLLSIRALSRLSCEEMAPLLRSSGYYNQKARRLRAFLDFLNDRYNGTLQSLDRLETGRLREELLQLHGFGRETVDSILLYAFQRRVFVVDAYTRRIFSRHGYCSAEVGYEELRSWIEARIPAETAYYNEFHALIVAVGKTHCRPSPRCHGCPLESKETDEKGKGRADRSPGGR